MIEERNEKKGCGPKEKKGCGPKCNWFNELDTCYSERKNAVR